MKMFLCCFKPKFYKKSKSTTTYMKIRLDLVRKKRIAMVNFLKIDIVNFLKDGHDYKAYTRAEVLLEELRIISCYDIIEQFRDCISENLSQMLKKRECPEECIEAVSTLIYAAAWVPDVPELKDLRAVFTDKFGNFTKSSVNHKLVEKTELRRRPSREVKIQTVKDIGKEFLFNWDPTSLHLMLLRQTSALQIEYKVERGADDTKIETVKNIKDQQSEDGSVLAESWIVDSFSGGSLSSSSSSSSGSLSREFIKGKKKTKIMPYGPPDKKGRNGEKEQEEKRKSVEQENLRLLGPQGSNEKERTRRRRRFRDLS